jgi:glycerol-3-phosphate acyltransferase PlsY
MSTSPAFITLMLIVLAYLLGSVPFSFLVARMRGVDLRTVGSGNIGGANVWRTVGFGPFLAAATLDMLKGMLPALAALHWARLPAGLVVLVGAAAILGHTFPLFLHFRGGKAVATSGGVLLALVPLLVLAGLVAWVLGFAATRMSAVGSLTAAAVVLLLGTILFLSGSMPLAYAVFIWCVVGFVVYLHRANIQRLRAGRENRFEKLF